MAKPLHIVVLAAGQGKRMQSRLPKVLHPVLFRPMLHPVLDLALSLSPKSVQVVVGHGEEAVREACRDFAGISFVRQKEQKGTGHALQQALPALQGESGRVLILSGDVILLRPESVQNLLRASDPGVLLTAHLESPRGYGRILRGGDGKVQAIREEVDCSDSERTIREVNAGIYAFDLPLLLPALRELESDNQQEEFYLTDVVEILVQQGKPISAIVLSDPDEMLGINDRMALAQAEVILRERINRSWMERGVTLQDPSSIWIDSRARLENDVFIESGCRVIDSVIESGTILEAGSRVSGCHIGKGVTIRQGCYLEGSRVEDACSVGPYARLRPGTRLQTGVKIGNFVEIKKSVLGEGTKASHLSYIGDAEIGRDVNIGCGFITCNYDGKEKHKTVIGDGVFIGSDSQAVAPITIGKGSYIGSGSTLTEDIPDDSLALSRSKQVTKAGYARKYRGPGKVRG